MGYLAMAKVFQGHLNSTTVFFSNRDCTAKIENRALNAKIAAIQGFEPKLNPWQEEKIAHSAQIIMHFDTGMCL